MRLRWWTVSLSSNVFQDHDGVDQAAVSAAAASCQELRGGEVVAGPAESSGARRLGTSAPEARGTPACRTRRGWRAAPPHLGTARHLMRAGRRRAGRGGGGARRLGTSARRDTCCARDAAGARRRDPVGRRASPMRQEQKRFGEL
jgi:hypothetical protein